MGKLKNAVIPSPLREIQVPDVSCACSDLAYLEFEKEHAFAASQIEKFWQECRFPSLHLQQGRQRKGPVHRIRLHTDDSLEKEACSLEITAGAVTIKGGSGAGVFYGVQSFLQIVAVSTLKGGMFPQIPAGIIHDKPRFPYRGIMLDSSRHFQSIKTIFLILDQMARFKYNRFHWHLTDRQGWRLPLPSFPELTEKLPADRIYSQGAYTPEEIAAVNAYAKERFITVIPEIEMPGHSAVIFRSRPDLACPAAETPFEEDVWEFCIGNPQTKVFLKKVLKETMALFPDSPVIHIGGDEASDRHWQQCPKCLAALKKSGAADFRELEHIFLSEMSRYLARHGRRTIIWDSGNSCTWHDDTGLILQNYLDKDAGRVLRHPAQVINSHTSGCYFDFPLEAEAPLLPWIRKSRDFDPACGTSDERILGGEGCVWTEKIPEWRIAGRTLPRLRALSEALWSPRRKPSFSDYLRRERMLMEHSFFNHG